MSLLGCALGALFATVIVLRASGVQPVVPVQLDDGWNL